MPLPSQRNRDKLIFSDAALIFKNFKGAEKEYNQEGDRNFSVMLGEEQALQLQQDGWNVKPLKRREEDEEQLYHLKVKVSFKNTPPSIWLISNVDPNTGIGRSKTFLGESQIGMFDRLPALKIDLAVSPYDWRLRTGQEGRTAYLDKLFFTMYEDELDRLYADVNELPSVGDYVELEGRAVAELESAARQQYDYDGEVVD